MVTGHIFSVESQDKADLLVKFLRSEDISARIEPVSSVSLNYSLKGKYDKLMTYLEAKKTEIEKKCQEIEADSEDADKGEDEGEKEACENTEQYPCQKMNDQDNNSDKDTSEDEGSDYEDDEEFEEETEYYEYLDEIEMAISQIKEEYSKVCQTLNEKTKGDVLLSEEEFKAGDEETQYTRLQQFIDEYVVLFRNEIIEFENNSFRIAKSVSPEDLDFYLVLSAFIMPSKEEREKYEIFIVKTISAKIDYVIRTGPEFALKIDLEKLGDALYNIGMEDDEIDDNIFVIQLKQEAIDHIYANIDESGNDSVDSLLERISEKSEEMNEETKINTIYKISPQFILSTIEDFKKLEIMRVKGNRIKKNR